MDSFINSHSLPKDSFSEVTHFNAITNTYLKINNDEIGDFWIIYCDSIYLQEITLFLHEVIPENKQLPLSFNINLSFDKKSMSNNIDKYKHLYKQIEEYISCVIHTIQYSIINFFNVSETYNEVISVFLKRVNKTSYMEHDNELFEDFPFFIEDDKINFYSKIIFPFSVIEKKNIIPFYNNVFAQIQMNLTLVDILSIPPINTFDEIFVLPDLKNWELYGSKKSLIYDPYVFCKIYGYISNGIINTIDLDAVFSLETYRSIPKKVINSQIDRYGLIYFLPIFLSLNYHDKILEAKEYLTIPNLKDQNNESYKKQNENSDNASFSCSEFERLKSLLSLISRDRAAYNWSLLDIGKSIYSVNPEKNGLELWKTFARKNDVISESECEEYWSTFNDVSNQHKVTIQTLEYFAEFDNPDGYNLFVEKERAEHIFKAINEPQHAIIASAFAKCFPYQFRCADYNEGIWFYYTGHVYRSCDQGDLIKFIIDNFNTKIHKIQADISAKISNSRDSYFIARNQGLISSIASLLKKLETDGFLKSLCSMLRVYCKKKRFMEWINMDNELFGCVNGIIDLRGGKPIFRHGKPEDYITLTGCNYPESYTWETPIVKETLKYIKQIFRDQEID